MQKKGFSKYGAQTWLLSKKDDTKTNNGVSRKQKNCFTIEAFFRIVLLNMGSPKKTGRSIFPTGSIFGCIH